MLGLDHPFVGRVVLANVLVVAIVAAAFRRNRRTATLWISFVAYFIITVAAIAMNRAMTYHVESADTPRYYTDILCFFVAYTLMSFTNDPSSARRKLAPRQFAAMATLTAVCCIFWLDAGARVTYLWDRPKRNEAFVQNVKDAIRRTGPAARIADTIVPGWVMPQWIWPLTQYRYFLLIFPKHGQVVPSADAAYRFTDQGNLVPNNDK